MWASFLDDSGFSTHQQLSEGPLNQYGVGDFGRLESATQRIGFYSAQVPGFELTGNRVGPFDQSDVQAPGYIPASRPRKAEAWDVPSRNDELDRLLYTTGIAPSMDGDIIRDFLIQTRWRLINQMNRDFNPTQITELCNLLTRGPFKCFTDCYRLYISDAAGTNTRNMFASQYDYGDHGKATEIQNRIGRLYRPNVASDYIRKMDEPASAADAVDMRDILDHGIVNTHMFGGNKRGRLYHYTRLANKHYGDYPLPLSWVFCFNILALKEMVDHNLIPVSIRSDFTVGLIGHSLKDDIDAGMPTHRISLVSNKGLLLGGWFMGNIIAMVRSICENTRNNNGMYTAAFNGQVIHGSLADDMFGALDPSDAKFDGNVIPLDRFKYDDNYFDVIGMVDMTGLMVESRSSVFRRYKITGWNTEVVGTTIIYGDGPWVCCKDATPENKTGLCTVYAFFDAAGIKTNPDEWVEANRPLFPDGICKDWKKVYTLLCDDFRCDIEVYDACRYDEMQPLGELIYRYGGPKGKKNAFVRIAHITANMFMDHAVVIIEQFSEKLDWEDAVQIKTGIDLPTTRHAKKPFEDIEDDGTIVLIYDFETHMNKERGYHLADTLATMLCRYKNYDPKLTSQKLSQEDTVMSMHEKKEIPLFAPDMGFNRAIYDMVDVVIDYDELAEEKLVDQIMDVICLYNPRKLCLSAYNGSRFDCLFLLKALSKRAGIKTPQTLMAQNSILTLGTMIFSTYVYCFDLCRFTNRSLDSLCRDFNVPMPKSELSHNKRQEVYMRSGWKRTPGDLTDELQSETYHFPLADLEEISKLPDEKRAKILSEREWFEGKNKFIDYCKRDVIGLACCQSKAKHLFEQVTNKINKDGEPFILEEYITLGHICMSACNRLWNVLGIKPLPGFDTKIAETLRTMCLAGRSQARIGQYCRRPLELADVVSLYPYAMLNSTMPLFDKVTHVSTRNPKKTGIYVTRVVKSNGAIPMVNDKGYDWEYPGSFMALLNQDDLACLETLKGCFEIQDGIEFETSVDNLFKEYVLPIYEEKAVQDLLKCKKFKGEEFTKIPYELYQKALPNSDPSWMKERYEAGYNQALREVLKALLNVLSGKMLQRTYKTETRFYASHDKKDEDISMYMIKSGRLQTYITALEEERSVLILGTDDLEDEAKNSIYSRIQLWKEKPDNIDKLLIHCLEKIKKKKGDEVSKLAIERGMDLENAKAYAAYTYAINAVKKRLDALPSPKFETIMPIDEDMSTMVWDIHPEKVNSYHVIGYMIYSIARKWKCYLYSLIGLENIYVIETDSILVDADKIDILRGKKMPNGDPILECENDTPLPKLGQLTLELGKLTGTFYKAHKDDGKQWEGAFAVVLGKKSYVIYMRRILNPDEIDKWNKGRTIRKEALDQYYKYMAMPKEQQTSDMRADLDLLPEIFFERLSIHSRFKGIASYCNHCRGEDGVCKEIDPWSCEHVSTVVDPGFAVDWLDKASWTQRWAMCYYGVMLADDILPPETSIDEYRIPGLHRFDIQDFFDILHDQSIYVLQSRIQRKVKVNSISSVVILKKISKTENICTDADVKAREDLMKEKDMPRLAKDMNAFMRSESMGIVRTKVESEEEHTCEFKTKNGICGLPAILYDISRSEIRIRRSLCAKHLYRIPKEFESSKTPS